MNNERIVSIRKKFIFLDALFMFQTFCCCLSSEIDPLFHLNLVVSDVRKDFDEDAEYSCAVTPQVRQTGNRLSGLAGTAYASLLA